MGWSFRWHDDAKTILICDIRDRWTWDDAHAVVQEQIRQMAMVDHGVHTIFWLHGIPTVPQGGSALANIHNLMSMQHPNEQMSIFIGVNRFGQSLADMVSKVYGMRDLIARYRFVSSIEQALDEIAAYEKQNA